MAQCKCAKRFQVEQIGENKYRVSYELVKLMVGFFSLLFFLMTRNRLQLITVVLKYINKVVY